MEKALKQGPVLCTAGPHQGRIGYLDDFGMDCAICPEVCCVKNCGRSRENCGFCTNTQKKHGTCPAMAIVYFGRIQFCSEYVFLPAEYCTNDFSTWELTCRILALEDQLGRMIASKKKALLFQELEYVRFLLYERTMYSAFSHNYGKNLLLLTDPNSKTFSARLYSDLICLGHRPWILEWMGLLHSPFSQQLPESLFLADELLLFLTSDTLDFLEHHPQQKTFFQRLICCGTPCIVLLLDLCKLPAYFPDKHPVKFYRGYEEGLKLLLERLTETSALEF